jgi:hypothetical protein
MVESWTHTGAGERTSPAYQRVRCSPLPTAPAASANGAARAKERPAGDAESSPSRTRRACAAQVGVRTQPGRTRQVRRHLPVHVDDFLPVSSRVQTDEGIAHDGAAAPSARRRLTSRAVAASRSASASSRSRPAGARAKIRRARPPTTSSRSTWIKPSASSLSSAP